MKYKLSLEVAAGNDAAGLYKTLLPDMEKNRFKRSTLNITRKGNRVVFSIEAQDIIALRASIQSVTNALLVYDKLRNTQ